METLQCGIILELLEDMAIEEKTVIDDCDDGKKPALLQIRSIIPVLAEDDLWPKQGFFLKVSDLTHAMYVSLPQEEDEMVLCNKLQLGQFIYVKKLEAAYPVPMLKGIKAIQGRHSLDVDPKDLVGIDIGEKICGSPTLLMHEKGGGKKKPGERARLISPCMVLSRDRRASTGGQNCSTRSPCDEKEGFVKGYSRNKVSFVDKKSDLDGVASSSTLFVSHSRRRSSCGILNTRSCEISDSKVVKHEITLVRHSPIACVSPVRSGRQHSSNHNSNPSTGIKDISTQSPQPAKIQKYGRKSSLARTDKEPSSNKKWEKNEMIRDTLPSSLIKLGKEVIRKRDAALLVAVETLEEAAATERLLRCLSTFSELYLSKENDEQTSINKFFELQDSLDQCRAIIKSLTNSSPSRTADTDLKSPGPIKEVVNLAVDRKRNAIAWAKAAVASDLIPLSDCMMKNGSGEAKDEAKCTNQPSQIIKLKGTHKTRKQRNGGEFNSGLADNKENFQDWVKGSALTMARNLAQSMQDECKTWLLAHIEKYLDGFNNQCLSKVPDRQVAESMCQIKRLNDWLDMIEKKEESNDYFIAENSALEACKRVRNKIYHVLLKLVERTAIVLENKNAATEG